jgi:hypothetical protein
MLPVPVGLGSIISLLLLYCLKKLTIRKSQDDFCLCRLISISSDFVVSVIEILWVATFSIIIQ